MGIDINSPEAVEVMLRAGWHKFPIDMSDLLSMVKIIIMDLDGTLLNDDKNISDYTLSILEKCKCNGIKIGLATARSKLSAKEIIDLVKPDFSILNNGALIIKENNEIIYNKLLSLESLDEIKDEHISGIDIEKMNAIEILSKEQNIPLSRILAFGDDYNDIEMIKKCGIGVAMENGIDEVKSVAKYICGKNNNDGVGKWIEENVLKYK
jgi:hydroxymethylpyrimidine pyrophosphatase-like HAD family hydrolase